MIETLWLRLPRTYQIVAPLGQGGFADVFRCSVVAANGLHLTMTPVAVKVLREINEPEYVARFHHEARIQRELNHPHLLALLDVNLRAQRPFIVMPMMRETLRSVMERFLNRREVFRAKPAIDSVALPIARAVEYLHARMYYHRDIKPQNIFFGYDNIVRLGDFGVCHMPSGRALVRTWCGLGSQSYTAPETLESGVATPQSDVYSVGVVLYEMLTGKLPGYGWWTEAWNLPSAQHPTSCHTSVDTVLRNMTHPDPRYRYSTMGQAISDLRTLSGFVLPVMPAYRGC